MTSTGIVIVDYGMGNLRSVEQALRHAAPEASILVSGAAADIDNAERLVFPGQGAMPDCMRCLRESGLKDALMRAAQTKPMLGVCVGEQLLFDWSEEGDTPGLGLLPGKVLKFRLDEQLQPDGSRFKVPQMGWNRVRQTMTHRLWESIPDDSYFYFVHSFYASPENDTHTAGQTIYGAPFASAVARDNIFATQFHPEKSAAAGLQLYRNFAHWSP